jgi:putative colanic acid biosynthesis acetyltransferase WcaF
LRLDLFNNENFERGRPRLVELLWVLASSLFFASWIPGSRPRVAVLRLFGADVGTGVVIKPRVKIKFPWKLKVGDHSWIGEDVWIDNLASVHVGNHCCISQGAYLCTGSHDWSKDTFDLKVGAITLQDGVWIAARAVVAPGVTAGAGAVLGLGSVATGDLAPSTVYLGAPAREIRKRPRK